MAYTGPNSVIANLSVEIETAASKYGELAGRLAAADGDREAALTAYVQTSDNAEVVKLREGIAKLNAKLQELAEKNVVSETLSEDEKAKLTVEVATLKEQVSKGQKAVSAVLASFDTDKEGVEKWLEEFKENDPTRSRKGRAVGSTGSSLPRVNVLVTVQGGELFKEPVQFESFAPACAKLKFPVKDMQEAFAAAAGVKHEDIKSVDKPVTFTVQPRENGAVYTVSTTPKAVGTPGRKKATDNAAPAATEGETEKAAV